MADGLEGAEFTGERLPFTPLPNWLRGRATAFEIAVLWVLQSHHPYIRPSLSRIAVEAGISRRKAQMVLADMERKGWLRRTQQHNDDGTKAPTVYGLSIWSRDRAGDAIGHDMPQGGRAQDALGVGHDVHGGRAPHAHKQDQENKINNNKNKIKKAVAPKPAPEPTPTDETALIPHHDPDSVVRSESPRKAPVDPYTSKTLPSHLVPDDLLELQQLLPEWWAVKKGVRSQGVFNRVCRRLRIWDHEQRIDALERAISGGWADLYEPRPSAGSSSPGNRLQLPLTGADVARRFFTLRSAS